ncbi:30S ribosomal protein S27ae [Candidatus Woesearchaeota archaeon]|nr:30S ribosomal protein S27ae [Candidatus Woesearchaeota archaeon]
MAEKKPRRKRKPVTTWKFFEKKGDSLQRKRKSCPKCGQGTFMAQHKGRITCGKCGYSEFETKKKE